MDPLRDAENGVDLDFTATTPAAGVLPVAVDTEGLPVPPRTVTVADLDEPLPADVAATLPRGDWTKVGEPAKWGSPLDAARHRTMARAVIISLMLLLFIPVLLVAFAMLGNLGNVGHP